MTPPECIELSQAVEAVLEAFRDLSDGEHADLPGGLFTALLELRSAAAATPPFGQERES